MSARFSYGLLGPLVLSLALSVACAAPSHRLTRATLALVDGVYAFHNGEHRQALECFEQASRLRPDDGEILYWRARAHLELAQLEEAAALFEKSLRVGTLQRATAEVGAYLDRTNARLASRPPPPEVVTDDKTTLLLPVWDPSPRLRTRFATSLGSSSNPGLLPDELDAGSANRIGSSQILGDAELLAEFYPVFDRRGRTVELSLEGRRSFYEDDSELDLGQARGLVQFAWGKHPLGHLTGPLGTLRVPSGTTKYSFLLQAGSLYAERGGKELYSASQGAFSIVCAEEKTAFQVDLAYQDFDFDPALSKHDGSEVRVRISQSLFFSGSPRRSRPRGPRWTYLRLGLGAGLRDAAPEFQRSSVEGSVEASLRTGSRHFLYLGGTLRLTDFDQSNREDARWRVSTTYVHRLRPELHLTARVTYQELDSTGAEGAAPDPDYDELKTSLGLAWYVR